MRDEGGWGGAALARMAVRNVLSGVVVGSFLGYMVVPWLLHFFDGARALADWLGLMPWLLESTWRPAIAGAVAGIGIGALSLAHELIGRAKSARRGEEPLQVPVGPDFPHSAVAGPALVEKLGHLTRGDAFAEARNALQVRLDGVTFTVCDLLFTPRDDSTDGSIAQTVALLESDALRLPQFALQPESGMLNFAYGIAGIRDIDFPEHPEFSKAYHLFAPREDLARRLFDRAVLDALGRRPGLCIDSEARTLALYRRNEIAAGAALNAFVRTAAEIFREFVETARCSGLSAGAPPPELDAREYVAKIPGLLGQAMREELVTREDIRAFVGQAPPRKIPANVLAYRDRQAPLLLAGVGTLSSLVGSALAFGFAYEVAARGQSLLGGSGAGILLGLFFVALGLPVACLSWRARSRIKRLLREGVATEGRVDEVRATGFSVNGRPQSAIRIRYAAGGREILASCKDMGHGAERARKLMDDKAPAPILYDPEDFQRILFVPALASLSPEIED
jgi:hypothetical protein